MFNYIVFFWIDVLEVYWIYKEVDECDVLQRLLNDVCKFQMCVNVKDLDCIISVVLIQMLCQLQFICFFIVKKFEINIVFIGI